ncbi:hypothetical protein LJC59_04700 [Desulfovibrio sp. OttesenSCG-928-A18]|nr:hypothetical protein [Desulfovibrio sp. OttesenSCG-928-A18]
MKSLNNAFNGAASALFIASTHEPATGRPDWKATRLLDFLVAQRGILAIPMWKHETEEEEDFASTGLVLSHILRNMIAQAPAKAAPVMGRAFWGEADAIREMARLYRHSGYGFFLDEKMSRAWLSQGAFMGDARCQLYMAVDEFMHGNPAAARAWALIAGAPEAGSTEQSRAARRLNAALEAQLSEKRLEISKQYVQLLEKAMAENAQRQQVQKQEQEQEQEQKQEQKQAAGKQGPASESPFAAAGLLEHKDEGVEDILFRAHLYDTRAMLAVAAGHARGVGGFPKEPPIAQEWLDLLEALGASEAALMVKVLLRPDNAGEAGAGAAKMSTDEIEAACALLPGSPLALAFRETGIIDISHFCARAASDSGRPFSAANSHTLYRYAKNREATLADMRLMRELRSRPASAEELMALREKDRPALLEVFASTTHAPYTQSPDWQAERLIEFFARQSAAEKKGYAQYSPMNYTLYRVNESAFKKLADDPARARDEIRRAHQGDLEAAGRMAGYYYEGSFFFPQNLSLSEAWLRFAALRGDAKSQLQLAVKHLDAGELPEALAWAAIAQKKPDPENAELTDYMVRSIQKASDATTLNRAEEYQQRYVRLMDLRKSWQQNP